MLRKLCKTLVLAGTILLGTLALANATDWYIKIGGAGSTNAGTYANPFTSVAAFNTASGSFSDGDDFWFYTTETGYTHSITGANDRFTWSSISGTSADQVVIGAYYDDGGSAGHGLGPSDTYPRPTLDGNDTGGGLSGGAIRYAPSGYTHEGYVTIRDIEIKNVIGYGFELNGRTGGLGGGNLWDSYITACRIYNTKAENTDSMGIGNYRTYNTLIDWNTTINTNRITTGVYNGGCAIDTGALSREGTSQWNTVEHNLVIGGNEGIGFYKNTRYWLCRKNMVINNRVPIYAGNSRDGEIVDNIIFRSSVYPDYRTAQMFGGICLASEDNQTVTPRKTSYIKVHNNYVANVNNTSAYVAGGITLTNPSGDSQFGPDYDWTIVGIYMWNNFLVDNEANFAFYQTTYMDGIYAWDNYSFVFEFGSHTASTSPANIKWYDPGGFDPGTVTSPLWDNLTDDDTNNGNFFNTTVGGNAGANADATDAYTLNDTTGWDALTSTVTSARWIPNEIDTTPPVVTTPTLNVSHDLATDMIAGYVFYKQSGTTVYDIVGDADGTISTADMWNSDGIKLDAVGQSIAIPMPDLLNGETTYSIAFAFEAVYDNTADWAKVFYDPAGSNVPRTFQLERAQLDTVYNHDLNFVTSTYSGVKDIQDGTSSFHTLVLTVDVANNVTKLYIDGVLESTQTETITAPTFGSTLYIGSKDDGTRNFFAIYGGVFFWSGRLLSATDVLAFDADYLVMVTNAPTRSTISRLVNPIGWVVRKDPTKPWVRRRIPQ